MTEKKQNRSIVSIEKFGIFRLEAILAISEPFPLDETSTLYGMEFYLSSGHTAVLRDPHPQFLLGVRRLITHNILLEENFLLPDILETSDVVLVIRRAANDPAVAEVKE